MLITIRDDHRGAGQLAADEVNICRRSGRGRSVGELLNDVDPPARLRPFWPFLVGCGLIDSMPYCCES
jgi:hypothetical protein